MPLISCPECKKKISDTVGNCPKCGYLLTPEMVTEIRKKEQQVQKGCGIGCLLLIVLFFVVPWLSSLGEKSTPQKSDQQPSLQTKAITIAERTVREYLKFPDDSEFLGSCCMDEVSEHGTLGVFGKVETHNSFGVKLTLTYMVVVIYRNGNLEVESVMIDGKVVYANEQ